MIPQENRLKHMKDFEILFKEGRFFAGKFITAKVWKIEPEKYPRRKYNADDLKIGFVVSVKVSKSAVKRNRIKRQMREVVRLLLKDGKLKTGFHVSIMAKPGTVGVEYKEIERDIKMVLERAGVVGVD
ncbi:MAG: ribonuclease P protein component [Candidatus Magasanikbacteria bacterium RIFCSPLOWO2_12_FULL_43_12]|uniref:Ribonuclease P protein component n=1 Tax=Candidatus Magasanikbacteria bacterium RIFCSPLOWO2_12_FULL_43_12 TaxID=1798692 RepID=A0A1F6MVF3_9BACT|nr:MAG: ribonuclease P protein component [Candidatus Magasanikbacteria bacterium RIFCSPLOWO2_02_FULL_43_22]OGH72134.1 MAG: ribonuclease P protein component [Candidatus Magasanikbacteria bacterium RIFCSPHIGHO2_02_FULL_44_13]OGH75647.1 MAG: ribonuclease P protein component [Candidatus Magasanikbacteria bacterium RIFCSPLOWO2_12_FULL_43_12]